MLCARRVFVPNASDVVRPQDGLCAICQARATLEIHHIVPVAAGGGSELENLLALCRAAAPELRLTVEA